MELNLCRLAFRGALHVGERQDMLDESMGHIPSDTLCAAVFAAWRLLYGEGSLVILLRRLEKGERPFALTSAFPYEGADLFFPCPRHVSADNRSWLTLRSFEKVLSGETRNGDHVEKRRLDHWLHHATRASVGRAGDGRQRSAGGLFGVGRICPPPDGGFYFLARFEDKKVRDRIFSAMRLLADEGIGGERSVGHGLFKYPAWETLELGREVREPSHRVLLSLYYPGSQTEAERLADGYYRLVDRRGYIHSPDAGIPLRWRPVRMAAEGAVLAGVDDVSGSLVEVTPGAFKKAHKVFRAGMALSLPIRIPPES
ncbi:MAG: type III-A CRISPR-associated RAMP protein Csm4 [Elusimicrobiota bacterium]